MNDLKEIKDSIESMDKYYQVEVLKILKAYPNVDLNENSNGTFINLTILDDNVISNLKKYIKYVHQQQTNLEKIEIQKEKIEKDYFKDNKDNNIKVIATEYE